MMKEQSRKALVVGGAIVSVYLALLMGSLCITGTKNVSHPLEGSVLAVLTLFGSPVALILTVLASFFSMKMKASLWVRSVFVGLNIVGATVAGGLSTFLVFLWRMGPINPG